MSSVSSRDPSGRSTSRASKKKISEDGISTGSAAGSASLLRGRFRYPSSDAGLQVRVYFLTFSEESS